MFHLEINFLFAFFIGYNAVIAFDNALFEFTATPNVYVESPSSKTEIVSELTCCTKCGFDEDCLALNYNRNTSECELLAEYSNNSITVWKKDWISYTIDKCGGDWVPLNRSCYLLVESLMSLFDADAYCKAHEAELVDIHSSAENEFVYNMIYSKGVDIAWIGLNDITEERAFVWSSGRPLTFDAWSHNQPNNYGNQDCVNIGQYNKKWNDVSCTDSFAFVCEKDYIH